MSIHFAIEVGSNIPIYKQIMNQIRRAIAMGELMENQQVPGVRSLARHLLVNSNTVSHAYGELVKGGVLESRPGLGCFVSQGRQVYSEEECQRRLGDAIQFLLDEAIALNFNSSAIRRALDEKLSDLEQAEKRKKHE
ncbi:GntR family transcriptional regulator [Planctomycetota bacterium]